MNSDSNHDAPSTLKWLLLILIVILLQYILTGWVGEYGNNTNIVSHVSFAGTIVSIILAVLAIVYTYYQGLSQWQDSSNLTAQVSQLSYLVKDVAESRLGLTSEVDRIAELGEKLDRSLVVAEESRSLVGGVAAKIEAMKAHSDRSATEPTPLPRADGTALGVRVARSAGPTQLAMYYAIQLGCQRRWSTRRVAMDLVVEAAKRKGVTSEAIHHWYDGILTGSWYLLLDLDLVKMELRDDELHYVSISSDFEHALAERVAAAESVEGPALDVSALRALIVELDAKGTGPSGTV
jgi:hypothetical protein